MWVFVGVMCVCGCVGRYDLMASISMDVYWLSCIHTVYVKLSVKDVCHSVCLAFIHLNREGEKVQEREKESEKERERSITLCTNIIRISVILLSLKSLSHS